MLEENTNEAESEEIDATADPAPSSEATADPAPEATADEPASEATADETTPADPNAKQTIEQWQIVRGTSQWLWAGMKLGKGWPIGKEVTAEEYDAAVKWAASVTCR